MEALRSGNAWAELDWFALISDLHGSVKLFEEDFTCDSLRK